MKKLKARKVTRYELWLYHNDARDVMHRLSMTEKQYGHVNAMPDGEQFFLSNINAVCGGKCWVIKRNGELYYKPLPAELAQELEQMPTTGQSNERHRNQEEPVDTSQKLRNGLWDLVSEHLISGTSPKPLRRCGREGCSTEAEETKTPRGKLLHSLIPTWTFICANITGGPTHS